MTIKVKLKVKDYVEVDSQYRNVEATKKFAVHTYDDLQNLLLTLIESSEDRVTFEIEKKEDE